MYNFTKNKKKRGVGALLKTIEVLKFKKNFKIIFKNTKVSHTLKIK